MPMTIPSVPEFITREQWTQFVEMCGFDPRDVVELRLARDGVHALVLARDETGGARVDPHSDGYYKHRVFIPTRDDSTDRRTTRIRAVEAPR